MSTLLGLLLAVAAVGVPVAWTVYVMKGVRRRARLLREGRPGQALILSFTPTSVSEGGRTVLRFVVRIVTDDGAAFDATVDHAPTVMEAPALQPGQTAPVRYLRHAGGIDAVFG